MQFSLTVTDAEQQLFDLLLASLKFKGKSTTLRVAGGWVRDKLLNESSNDIDIALDDQSGLEFATSVNEYLTQKGLETRTIAVIQANPDQSKHLETAMVRVLGWEIDCVNLRAETYSDTRIPIIRNGTAEEDALRRDFTINALFYNINTRCVEDFTRCGVDDLQAGIIRTPVNPHITFNDDPLRVLRAIRFASRFDFTLDNELVVAGSSEAIRTALRTKVSRERVYKECDGCMTKSNCRPYLAFSLMQRMDLLDVILPLDAVLSNFPLIEETNNTMGTPVTAEVIQGSWLGKHNNNNSAHIHTLSHLSAPHMLYWLNVTLTIQQFHMLGHQAELCDISQARAISEIQLRHCKYEAPSNAASSSCNRANASIFRAAQVDPSASSSTSQPAAVVSTQFTGLKALFWAASTFALRGYHVKDKKQNNDLSVVLLREGLKMENAMLKSVQILHECSLQFEGVTGSHPMEILNARKLLAEHSPDLLPYNQVLQGYAYRVEFVNKLASILRAGKELWRQGLQLALVTALSKHSCWFPAASSGNNKRKSDEDSTDGVKEQNVFESVQLSVEMQSIIADYATLERIIEDFGLDGVWTLKPLMNGAEIATRLGLPTKGAGPILGQYIECATQWQIRKHVQDTVSGQKTSLEDIKNDCVEYLKLQNISVPFN